MLRAGSLRVPHSEDLAQPWPTHSSACHLVQLLKANVRAKFSGPELLAQAGEKEQIQLTEVPSLLLQYKAGI